MLLCSYSSSTYQLSYGSTPSLPSDALCSCSVSEFCNFAYDENNPVLKTVFARCYCRSAPCCATPTLMTPLCRRLPGSSRRTGQPSQRGSETGALLICFYLICSQSYCRLCNYAPNPVPVLVLLLTVHITIVVDSEWFIPDPATHF